MEEYINEPWSSLDEVASYLGVNKDTIRNWIKKTDIPRRIKLVGNGNSNCLKLMLG